MSPENQWLEDVSFPTEIRGHSLVFSGIITSSIPPQLTEQFTDPSSLLLFSSIRFQAHFDLGHASIQSMHNDQRETHKPHAKSPGHKTEVGS